MGDAKGCDAGDGEDADDDDDGGGEMLMKDGASGPELAILDSDGNRADGAGNAADDEDMAGDEGDIEGEDDADGAGDDEPDRCSKRPTRRRDDHIVVICGLVKGVLKSRALLR